MKKFFFLIMSLAVLGACEKNPGGGGGGGGTDTPATVVLVAPATLQFEAVGA